VTTWRTAQDEREARIRAGATVAKGKVVDARDATALREAVLRPGDRLCLEGDNQEQRTSSPARSQRSTSPRVHDLHMAQSGVVLPEHLDLFERGVATRLDFSYSGPQSERIATMLRARKIALGTVHTYLELFARYFVDLTPQVALIVAVSADRGRGAALDVR
jgi:malonate decarboxylase alpha subunit